MSNPIHKSQIPVIRNFIEERFGQFRIGQEGDRSSSSRYIGIHYDERDNSFKQWFTASPNALKLNNECNGNYCGGSLTTTFLGATQLLESLGKMTPQSPPLELPSTDQLNFIAKTIPHMLSLSFNLADAPVQDSSNRSKTTIFLVDPSEYGFLTRDNTSQHQIGLILPVYSLPIPGFDA